jgi:hypothetical protein
MMVRALGATVLGLGVLVLPACASTSATIRKSWQDPAITASTLAFDKVLVVGVLTDSTQRRKAEDELVLSIQAGPRGQAGEVTATAAHTLLGATGVGNAEALRSSVSGRDFDGAVTLRFVGSEYRISWEPDSFPAPYHDFWSYYAWGWRTATQPGYFRMDTSQLVETNVYSLPEGKLVWSALSESFNPASSRKLTAAVARAIGEELRKQGLIAGG